MKIDLCDVMVAAGMVALIIGLFLIDVVLGLTGGGALLTLSGLALAKMKAKAGK